MALAVATAPDPASPNARGRVDITAMVGPSTSRAQVSLVAGVTTRSQVSQAG